MPRDLGEAVAGDAARLSHRRVRAEQPSCGELPTCGEDGSADDDSRRRGQRPEPQKRPESPAVSCGDRVDDGGEEERREEHQRLEAHRCGGGGPRDEDAVAPHRGLLERPCEHEQGHGDDRQRQRLGHEEPGVVERGGHEHERCRRDRPPRRREAASPHVGRHGDERHRERLEDARPLDAVREIVEGREGRADQRRREKAVVRRGEGPQGQRPVRPEALAQHPVDHLVGRDPGRRERLRRGEADHGRRHDEAGDGERGARDERAERGAARGRLRAGHPGILASSRVQGVKTRSRRPAWEGAGSDGTPR